jgi:hypothetical protein
VKNIVLEARARPGQAWFAKCVALEREALRLSHIFRHCEKRSDEAIQDQGKIGGAALDCFALLAMTMLEISI